MTKSTFVLLLLPASAALALWVHVRFPRLGPEDWRVIVLHLGFSAFVLHAATPVTMREVVSLGPPFGGPAAGLGVALPALVYLFLVWAWTLRFARRLLGGTS